jgi:hypothetical protein
VQWLDCNVLEDRAASIFRAEDGGSMVLQNVGIHPLHYTAHPENYKLYLHCCKNLKSDGRNLLFPPVPQDKCWDKIKKEVELILHLGTMPRRHIGSMEVKLHTLSLSLGLSTRTRKVVSFTEQLLFPWGEFLCKIRGTAGVYPKVGLDMIEK